MIRATDLKLVSDWERQPCPICEKPLSQHLLATQDISANYSQRTLRLDADVFCGATNRTKAKDADG